MSATTKKIEGFFWLGLGAIVCLLSRRVGLGSFSEPGSGFIAFIVGLFLAVLGLIVLSSDVFRKKPTGTGTLPVRPFQGAPLSLLLSTVGVLIGYGLFLEKLGYILTTFLVMGALFYFFHERGKRRLGLSAFAAFATTGVTYLVFEVWLHSQLPRGIFPWW